MAKHVRQPEKKNKKKKGGKWWKILLAVLGAIVLLVSAAFGVVYFTLGRAIIDPYRKSTTYDGQDMLDSDLPAIDENGDDAPTLATLAPLETTDDGEQAQNPNFTPETAINDGKTLQQLIRNWCANGSPVSSKQVLNILLIGIDNYDININGRADALILVSINTQTRTFTLASLLRDQYAYIVADGKESFEKMHLSNNRGGPECLIATIESHYKVQIDNYIMASLETFPKIIDRLGGVTLTLTQAEVNYLGEGYVVGEQRLDGAHALRYARLRQIDSEQERTGRERKLLNSLMTEMKGASLGELVGLVTDLLPYVRTGLTQTQMISLATRAVSEGWLNYSFQQFYTPSGSCWKGGMLDGLWYWYVDYPVAAHDFQMKLYGRSNITLLPDRTSFLRYPIR